VLRARLGLGTQFASHLSLACLVPGRPLIARVLPAGGKQRNQTKTGDEAVGRLAHAEFDRRRDGSFHESTPSQSLGDSVAYCGLLPRAT
jgi:hypothetical protein